MGQKKTDHASLCVVTPKELTFTEIKINKRLPNEQAKQAGISAMAQKKLSCVEVTFTACSSANFTDPTPTVAGSKLSFKKQNDRAPISAFRLVDRINLAEQGYYIDPDFIVETIGDTHVVRTVPIHAFR